MLAGSSVIREALKNKTWKAFRDGKEVEASALKIGPHSIDVSLGNKFIFPERQTCVEVGLGRTTNRGQATIDPYSELQPDVKWNPLTAHSIVLMPGRFVLAYVRERFETKRSVQTTGVHPLDFRPDSYRRHSMYFTQCYDGRSTMGRLGIMSHVTAGYGDLGFCSNFTLELHNVNPDIAVKLYAGMRIGQISFHAIATLEVGEEEPVMYNGSYTEQADGPVVPRLGKERFVNPGEGADV
jgi:deoxycytidine triphosphate deaminase